MATVAVSPRRGSPNTTTPAGIAEALPAIEVAAMTGTAGPAWRERADAKKATPLRAMGRHGLSTTSAMPRATVPVSALTATWVTVKSSPAVTPSVNRGPRS